MRATAEAKIVFRMTATVWMIHQLDDCADQTYPSYEDLGGDRYAMSREDLTALLSMTEDRMDDSFEHAPATRRALRLAAAKMRAALDTADRHLGGPNEERLVAALSRAIAEHGAPNGFYPRELWLDYGAPHFLIIGKLMRNAAIKVDMEERLGCALSYGPGDGHNTGWRIGVERSLNRAEN